METVTISKEEYFHLKEDIQEIKENYVSKSEIESLIETFEVLSDEKLMNSIRQSEREIKEGCVQKLDDFDELLEWDILYFILLNLKGM